MQENQDGRKPGRFDLQEQLKRTTPTPEKVYIMLLDLKTLKSTEETEEMLDTITRVTLAYGLLAQEQFEPSFRFAFWNTVNQFYRGQPDTLTGQTWPDGEPIESITLTDTETGILKQLADRTHIPYSGEQHKFDLSVVPNTEELKQQLAEWNRQEFERIKNWRP